MSKKPLEASIILFNQWYVKNQSLYSINDIKGIFLNTLKRELKRFFPETPMRLYHDNLNINVFTLDLCSKGMSSLCFTKPAYASSTKEKLLEELNNGIKDINYISLQVKSALDFTNTQIEANQIINTIANFKFK